MMKRLMLLALILTAMPVHAQSRVDASEYEGLRRNQTRPETRYESLLLYGPGGRYGALLDAIAGRCNRPPVIIPPTIIIVDPVIVDPDPYSVYRYRPYGVDLYQPNLTGYYSYPRPCYTRPCR
jgi:hypothetical protein